MSRRVEAHGHQWSAGITLSQVERSMELAQIKQAWAKRGFTYTLWTDPPGQVWEDFVHEVDELVTLVEGAQRD